MKLLRIIPPFGCAIALAWLSALPPLHAKTTPASRTILTSGVKEVPQRNFAVCLVMAPTLPELYFRNSRGDYQRLQIDNTSFNNWNVIPALPSLDVFNKTETLESSIIDAVTKKVVVTPAKVTYNPVASWTLPPGTADIRKLFYYDSGGKVLEYNMLAVADHAAFQVRVINLLTQPATICFDDNKQLLAAQAETIITAARAPEQVFRFQYSVEIPAAAPFVAATKKLRFHSPQQRLTTIIGYCPVMELDESGKEMVVKSYAIDAIRFFEELDKLPKPLRAQ